MTDYTNCHKLSLERRFKNIAVVDSFEQARAVSHENKDTNIPLFIFIRVASVDDITVYFEAQYTLTFFVYDGEDFIDVYDKYLEYNGYLFTNPAEFETFSDDQIILAPVHFKD